MKTKRHNSQRKPASQLTKRHHALVNRVKEGGTRNASQPTRHQVESSAPCRPAEVECIDMELCDDGLGLLRSTVIDEGGHNLVMSIEIPLPCAATYDAWIRFDHVPHFMRGTPLSDRCDGSRMTWRVRTLFDQFAWQAKVCAQVPFEFIIWKSVQGTPHPGFGSVIFEPNGQQKTRISVNIGFDKSGPSRWLGNPMPSISSLLEQSLKRFHDSLAG